MASKGAKDGKALEGEEAFFLEKVEMDEDSDDNFDYDEVAVDSGDELEDDGDEDLESALESIKRKIKPGHGNEDPGAPKVPPVMSKRPEVLDDFIRNFLIKMKLDKTLETFQAEWYELTQKGILTEEDVGVVPDIYLRNQQMDDNVKYLRTELDKARKIAEHAESMFDNLRKERDFHRMHHKRVVQEKNSLIKDLRRLREHYKHFEPALQETKDKYERLMREKSMLKLDRDKLNTKVAALEQQLNTLTLKGKETELTQASSTRKSRPPPTGRQDSVLPPDDRQNPWLNKVVAPAKLETMQMAKTFEGHKLAVTDCKVHPKKPIAATCSDDGTWMLWALPSGELIIKGEGHKDWIAACDFHPRGSHLVTGSGDATVKLWDFAKTACAATFTEHTQAVWDVAYHDSGDFCASSSMDHTVKLWDLGSARCRQTLRGHVDSVNAVCFQPYSNNIATSSGDKTVSLWDARTGLCMQTFYGHMNACNSVAFNNRGDCVVSSDADGVVKLWDIRMVHERLHINAGEHAINQAKFDPSGSMLAVATDEGVIKVFNCDEEGKQAGILRGHTDAVQSLCFGESQNGGETFMLSAGSDATFRMWQ